jgi:hypothetical protein
VETRSPAWSSKSGTEDKPENYATVTYALHQLDGGGTLLTLSQDNCKTEEQKKHSEDNWGMVPGRLRKVVVGK